MGFVIFITAFVSQIYQSGKKSGSLKSCLSGEIDRCFAGTNLALVRFCNYKITDNYSRGRGTGILLITFTNVWDDTGRDHYTTVISGQFCVQGPS